MQTDSSSLQFLVLVAGTNEVSNSNMLADVFIEGLKANGNASVEKIRLRDLSINHFTMANYDPSVPEEPDFVRVKNAITQANGVVISTPIWNFSVPAHLKNLIDRIGSFALDAETRSHGTLGGKPFYFLYTGGAPVPAWKGLMRFTVMHVHEGFRYFGGTIVGKFFEGKCMVGRGQFGLVVDKRPQTLMKVRILGMKFENFVRRFVETGKLPLYYRAFDKAYKLGQRIMAKF